MENFSFNRIAKLKFEGKYYQMYKTQKGLTAFLTYDEQGGYVFPTYEDFSRLVQFFLLPKEDRMLAFNNGSHFELKFIPQVIGRIQNKTLLTIITSALVLSSLTGCANTKGYEQFAIDGNRPTIDLGMDSEDSSIAYDSEIDEITNSSFVETEDYELLASSKYIQLYNNKYFTQLFGVENYSVEEVISILHNNKNIDQKFFPYIEKFIKTMADYYPGLDFRVFVENLKTLKIVEKKQEDLTLESGGLAYYNDKNNTLVVSDTLDLENDSLSKIIFNHELGHAYNNLNMTKDGFEIKYHFNDAGRGKFTGEALDVLFTTAPFLNDYNETQKRNMGYPITTNITRVITDSLPNYELQDSVTNNIYYLQNQMNEFMNDDIDSSIIIELIEVQWTEYISDYIEVNVEDEEDLYRYITRMYIKANVTEDMSYETIKKIEQSLNESLCQGVKNVSLVRTNVVTEEFDSYILEHNIEPIQYSK